MIENENPRIAILGAGVAGLAACVRIQEENLAAVIYEKEDTYGGLCNSFSIDGFTFDTFAHINFDSNTKEWLEEKTSYYTHAPEALNYDNGRWLRHPVQNNLVGLPIEERIRIIESFVDRPKEMSYNDYGSWLKTIYGEEFAIKYPYKYTRKYWTIEPEQLETKWVKGRMYEPRLDEVLRGAMTQDTPGVHYSKTANYPQKGGFKAFLEPMAKKCYIEYNKCVKHIYTSKKYIEFYDGSKVQYDTILSTIPLPELCKVIEEIPKEIAEYVKKLQWTTGVMVSLGFSKTDTSPSLWYYIYDEEILPARIYAPEWKSPNNVPQGCSAIQAEIYYSIFRPMNESLKVIKEKTIEQMLKLGLFSEEDIIVQDVRMKDYANIIFTPDIYKARKILHSFLESQHIYYAGRFGEWDYLWTGQSLLSGRKAAERLIKERGKKDDIKSKNKNII